MLALPIFPASHPASIVGEGVLNFCVRDGNRWTHTPINTNYSFLLGKKTTSEFHWLFSFLILVALVTRRRVELLLTA